MINPSTAMSDPKSVSPYYCLPLLEDALPDAGGGAPDAFRLPQSFPAELLDEEQLEAVAEWFDAWVADLLHNIRLALLGNGAPADLPHLHRHATVLCHLLRLHPAAEGSITELATALGCSRRTLFYARDAVLEHIRPAMVGTIGRKQAVANFYTQLVTIGTLDATRGTLNATIYPRNARTLIIPFKTGTSTMMRFATVRLLAGLPAVAGVKECLTADNQNAVQITLK